MKVRDLRAALGELDDALEILVPGYEADWDVLDVVGVATAAVVRTAIPSGAPGEWWYGTHEAGPGEPYLMLASTHRAEYASAAGGASPASGDIIGVRLQKALQALESADLLAKRNDDYGACDRAHIAAFHAALELRDWLDRDASQDVASEEVRELNAAARAYAEAVARIIGEKPQ
jgi:hypothetical protein